MLCRGRAKRGTHLREKIIMKRKYGLQPRFLNTKNSIIDNKANYTILLKLC